MSTKIIFSILLLAALITACAQSITPSGQQNVKLDYSVSGCDMEKGGTRGPPPAELVDVDIAGNNVKLVHHLNYVCCAKIKVILEKIETIPEETRIVIAEKNEGEMCRCVCDYDIDINLGPLAKGKYTVQIFGVVFEDMPVEKLWEREITVGEEKPVQMPNPASAHCIKQGGRLEIRKDTEGNEYGICIFADRSECDEWALFRGECGPGRATEPKTGFCGTSTNGQCTTDSDCTAGGCSGQVCQSKAEEPIITTCEYRDCYNAEAYGVECSCVNGVCAWK